MFSLRLFHRLSIPSILFYLFLCRMREINRSEIFVYEMKSCGRHRIFMSMAYMERECWLELATQLTCYGHYWWITYISKQII